MSLYLRSCCLKAQTSFRNVIGSSADPRPLIAPGGAARYSWIDLWRVMTNSTEVVCAVNIYHGGVIIGGHIVLGNAGGGASSVDSATLKDSNRVFIVPLCNACNQQSITQSLPYITPVVQLGGYFFDEDVESFRPGFDSDYYRIHGKTNGQDYNRAWQVQCNHHRQMCDAFRGAGTAHFDSAFMRITI